MSLAIAVFMSALILWGTQTIPTDATSLGLKVMVLLALAERCWDVLEGKPRELRVPGVTPPGGETPEQFEERVLAAFAAIPTNGLPLVVAHPGVFRVLGRSLGRLAPAKQIANAQPVLCRPPDGAHPAWRLEPVGCDVDVDQSGRVA